MQESSRLKILIIGKGGREHALALKAKQSPLVKKVFIAPGNIGMKDVGELVDIDETDIKALSVFAKKEKIDLTIVGPESSLSLGVVDEFEQNNLSIFGPSRQAAQIETSKDFAKKLMKKYNIPTASYKSVESLNDGLDFLKTQKIPIVIKEDGLKAGKGVSVCFSFDEAKKALENAFNIEQNKVLIEEYLEGIEFSIIALVHEDKVMSLEIAQDYKRAYDGHKGENTGGMGAYSRVDIISEDIINEAKKKILEPLALGMNEDKIPFSGFLYAGVMATKEGVKTIEFNARFGDPEAQILLPRLKSDLIYSILELKKGNVTELDWDKDYVLGVVMASKNYPKTPEINKEIIFSKSEKSSKSKQSIKSQIYYMGVGQKDNKLISKGGRILTLVAKASSIEKARDIVYEDLKNITCEGSFYRKDIGF